MKNLNYNYEKLIGFGEKNFNLSYLILSKRYMFKEAVLFLGTTA